MNKLATSILEELWFGEDDPAAANQNASRSLAAKLGELEGLRPFPVVVQKVIAYIARPDFQVTRVRAIIEDDPALAARILRVANSAAFKTIEPCKSIQDAVVRMGARTVADLACAMATMTVFRDMRGDGQVIREHCVGTAAAARALACRTHAAGEPGIAFLAGLLHDIGKLLLLQAGDRAYAELPGLASSPPDEFHLKERERLGYDHAVLGGHVLSTWGLPQPLPKVVAWHHQPARALQVGGTVSGLVAVLRIADVVDTMIARGQPLDEVALKRIVRGPDAIALDLKERDVVELWAEVPALRGEALSLFR